MINKISALLRENKVYHKIEKCTIVTRRSKTKIPKINADIMYLLGVIEGDGSLTKTKRKRGGYHYLIRIYSGEEKYLFIINQLFRKYFLINSYIKRDLRKKNAFWLEVKNAPFFFYLSFLGINHGKKMERKIPKFAKKNKNYLKNYLAGLIDTDGSVYNKRIQLKQKSKILVVDIKKELEKMRLNPSEVKINYTNYIPFYYIRFDNKLPLRLKKAFK